MSTMASAPSEPANFAEQKSWRTEFYTDAQGRRPVREWLDKLTAKTQTRITRSVELLETYGTQLRMPHARHLRGKLWELRIAVGREDYRILYVAVSGHTFLLLHAISKKTAKTPAHDLETAERRLKEYDARQKGKAT